MSSTGASADKVGSSSTLRTPKQLCAEVDPLGSTGGRGAVDPLEGKEGYLLGRVEPCGLCGTERGLRKKSNSCGEVD